jgi:hypothetical protein
MRLIVVGGVHGDEPSGAQALPKLAAAGFVTVGPANPWGLAANRRGLADGRDLNRAFRDPACPEAEAVRRLLRDHPPTLLLDLHEDSRATEPYLIQYGPDDDVCYRVRDALSPRYRFHPRPRFGPVAGRDGVLRPPRWMVAAVGASPWWPLVYWSWRTFGATGIVVEAPGRWPLADRVALHVAVAEAAREVTGRWPR